MGLFNAKDREIRKLKKKAKRAYLTIHGRDHSCGIELSRHISPHIDQAVRDFDDAVARLREIDPAFPATLTIKEE